MCLNEEIVRNFEQGLFSHTLRLLIFCKSTKRQVQNYDKKQHDKKVGRIRVNFPAFGKHYQRYIFLATAEMYEKI